MERQKELEMKEKLGKEIWEKMESAGISIDDLQQLSALTKVVKAKSKRPAKYKIKDKNGKEVLWTGIGRMPRVFSEALAEGDTIEKFRINK